MNRESIINLILEGAEEDIVPISEKKEERLTTLLYDLLEECKDDAEYEDNFENAVYMIKRFVEKHISDSLSPEIFKKCLSKAIKDFKEDSDELNRSEKVRLNKFVKFIKEHIED